MINIIYCYNNGKVGKEGQPYICIFRNRVDGSYYLGLASVVWNGVRYSWQNFSDIPSYPFAYIDLDKEKLTSLEFIERLVKEIEVKLEESIPASSLPTQLELPL